MTTRHILTYLFAILLSGCGSSSDHSDVSSYSCSPDCDWSGIVSERNDSFTLSYDPTYPPDAAMIDEVQRWWDYMVDCSGYNVDIKHAPVTIQYVAAGTVYNGTAFGVNWYEKGLIKVVAGDLQSGGVITRHEMLHSILYHAGVSSTANSHHNSKYFALCGSMSVKV